ncbi:hypothetical protein B7R22_11430 [Subtercola boreus]|uniref:Uncharacterized protein n=1 Tax=Subtercola boreus TaxID=120213 RepID=A0A3E0VVY5_9MICO|nr:hypothetical protein [Subtercola boreus]RFA13860.1 hypothetical protein B7R22_11430 [Subtercola boreus]
MKAEWDESFFERVQVDAAVYWVCFWTHVVNSSERHDPTRIDGADSVEEVLAWIDANVGTRSYELFVEVADRVQTVDHGRVDAKKLVRLAGDIRPS